MAVTNLSTLLGTTPTTKPWTNASASFTAVAKNNYQLVLSSSITVTLPASPNNGDYVRLLDYSQNCATYNVIVNNNGKTIQGINDTLTINVNGISVELTYITGQGWIITDTGNITAPATAYGFRNLIINGDFKIAQRATSGALTNSATYVSVDRWTAGQNTTANGIFAQVASGLTGFQYAAKLGRNSGATTTGGIAIQQVLETTNSIPYQNQQVTISFYAKAGANYSSASNLLSMILFTGTGTDQTTASIGAWTNQSSPVYATPTITTSWQRFTYTGTISATATQIGIQFAYTPTGTAGADDNIYITGVQLESGIAATPFEIRPYQSELALCQRYYYRITGPTSGYTNAGIGRAYATTNGQVAVTLPVSLRAFPTGNYSALSDWNACNTVNAGLPTAMTIVSHWSSDFRIMTIDLTATYTVGQTIALNANNVTTAWIDFSAEL